jgi:hypothetical protein
MLDKILMSALLTAGIVSPAFSQLQVPVSFSDLKPHEIVEAVTSEARAFGLTKEQRAQLDSLHVSVRDERHRWTRGPSHKAHKPLRMEPMISSDEAYGDALAILTPAQRDVIAQRFGQADYVPVVPSLASEVPAAFDSLKPHEIVQVFVAEAEALDLSMEQIEDLEALHVAVRDEPHRYTSKGAPGKAHRHSMMEPMISKRRAYNDARSYLTPAQQETAYKLFNAPGYKPAVS